MPGDHIRLLALDGGGVRGLSSLMILRRLMAAVDPASPPKPCDYFDMIGGTSTGGLIAILLGRLRMTVDECIAAYTSLSDRVFEKKSHWVDIKGQLRGRFDSNELEGAIKQILGACGLGEDALLKDVDASCKVFVCATSKQTGDTVCLASYRSPRNDNSDLLESTTIWEAGRATSAATTFFDPIAIGPFGEEFVDGALGANNPVYAVWNQAQDIWGDQLQRKLRCFVSIGTGVPTLKPVRDDVLEIWTTLKELATETEKTAQQFHRDKSHLDDEGRYYRFNVDRGLEEIGLQESKKKADIAAATRRYIESQAVFKQMKACANNLAAREYFGAYRTPFSLQGMPISNNFVDRPSDRAVLERHLLPRPHFRQIRRRVFVLHGLGGIGKTQLAVDFARRHQTTFSSVFWLDGRSENRLRQSIASCAKRIPQGQIPDKSRNIIPNSEDDLNDVVRDVIEWLARPDNADWLLVLDNVDQDHEQGGATGAYDVQKYLTADQGSVLITTRESRLAQLGEAKELKKADEELSKAIFQQWRGEELVMDETGITLLGLLDGLPLALAQAAAYIRETELDMASYVRLYKDQWDELIQSEKNGSPLADYERSVGTTWTISYKAVEAKSKCAANLVLLWAFLNNRDLWYGLLQTIADKELSLARFCDFAFSEIRFTDAVRLLLRYSMIEAQESVPGSYVMHPVVHRWTAHIQDGVVKRVNLRMAIMTVGLTVPSNTTKDYWVLQRRLLPHAERCLWWIKDHGKNGEAEWVFEAGGLKVMEAMHNLGDLYLHQSRLADAEALYERALQGTEKALGLDHRLTLGTVNNLAVTYSKQDRFAEAEILHERALQGYKAFGPDHPSTLGTVHNLAILYSDQCRFAEAESLCQRALQGKEKAYGPDHPSTLETVNILASLYKNQGRLAEAEALHERALQGKEKALGPDHLSTLDTVNNFAMLYSKQGRLAEAEVLYERALQGKEKALGPDHTSTLDTVNNLAMLYSKQGRLAEAEVLYERALQGREKTLGPDHTSTLNTVNKLAILYFDQGRLAQAEAFHERALQGQRRALETSLQSVEPLRPREPRTPFRKLAFKLGQALKGTPKAVE